MILNYLGFILLVGLCILYSMWTSVSEAKIKYMERRNKSIDKIIEKGYKISKRWDCNVMTIVIDTEKKVIGCVVLGLTSKLYIIEKKDISTKPEIKISGVIPKFTTNICVIFKCKDNNFYFLRTLSIKKGFGVLEKSKTAQTAVKQAEEILEVLKNF